MYLPPLVKVTSCVTFMGPGAPRLNITSGCVCEVCQKGSALELVQSVKQTALPGAGGRHPVHCGTEEDKRWKEEEFGPLVLPCCLSWDISSHRLPLDCQLAWFSGLWTQNELHHLGLWLADGDGVTSQPPPANSS